MQRAQHAEPVEHGHREVERDDIGIELLDQLERVGAVVRGRHHVELAVAAQDARQHGARERRVVDDEHARLAALLGHGARR